MLKFVHKVESLSHFVRIRVVITYIHILKIDYFMERGKYEKGLEYYKEHICVACCCTRRVYDDFYGNFRYHL